MPFICQVDEAVYLRCLSALFRSYCDESMEEDGFNWLSFCCIKPQNGKFFLECDAINCWREIDLERRQSMNVKASRLDGWHTLDMFALPPREQDLFYQVFGDMWAEREHFRALGIPTSIIFLYTTDKAQPGTGLERNLIVKVDDVECLVTPHGAVLRFAWYGPIDRLGNPRMLLCCRGVGELLYVSLGSIKL